MRHYEATSALLCLLAGCSPSTFSHWHAEPPRLQPAPPSSAPEACHRSPEPDKPTGHTPLPEVTGELRLIDVRGDDRFAMLDHVEMAWSNDGERIYAATNDGVFIWRATTGALERHFDLGKRIHFPRNVIVSPDNQWLVVVANTTSDWNKPPDVWTLRTDGTDKPKHQSDMTDDARFFPNGTLLSNDTLWDLATGTRTKRIHIDGPVAYLPDGARAIVYVKQNDSPHQSFTIELRNLISGAVLHHFGAVEMTMQTSLSEDGRRLAILLKNGELSVYSTDSFERVAFLRNVGKVRRVKLSSDGHRAVVEMPVWWAMKAAGGVYDPAHMERTMSVWDLETNERLLQADAHAGNHWHFSQDGKWLKLSENMDRNHLIRIADGKEIPYEQRIRSVSPDVRRAVVDTILGLEIAAINDDKLVSAFSHTPRVIARSADGRLKATLDADKFVRIENATTCIRLDLRVDPEAHQVVFSSDGLSLFAIPDTRSDRFRAYDARSGIERWAMQAAKGSQASVHVLPAANMVLFDNFRHRDVFRFDAVTGKPLPKGAKPAYTYVSLTVPSTRVRDDEGEFIDYLYNPVAGRNGLRIVSESGIVNDCSLAIWNLRHPNSVEDRPSECGRFHKTLSPDERWLAAGDEHGRIRVLSWYGDESHFIAEKHSSAVTSIAFTPTSHRLISASDDGTIIMANPANGQVTGRARLPLDRAKQLWISPDGREVIIDTARGLQVHLQIAANLTPSQ